MPILLPRPRGPATKLKRAYRTQARRIMLATLADERYGEVHDVGISRGVLRLITAAFVQLDKQLQRTFERRIPELKGRELTSAATVANAVRENVALIKQLPVESANDLAAMLRESSGVATEVLAKRIKERFGVLESKAEFWATDQTLKRNSDLTQARSVRAGLTHYRWITSNDERVRPEHAALDGQIFAWNDPPPPGNPGQDYRCRCTAEPLFPDEV